MLYYILSGVDNRILVCKLRGAQSKVIYLEQVIEAGQALTDYLHIARRSAAEIEAQEVLAVADECIRTLATIEKGINAIPIEFGAACKEESLLTLKQLSSVAKKIKIATKTTLKVSKYLDMLDQYMTKWQNLLSVAIDETRQLLHEFGLDSKLLKRIETETGQLEAMVSQKLAEAMMNKSSDAAERANSVFMRLMRRTVDRHRTNIEKWRKELATLKEQICQQKVDLENDPTIVIGEKGEGMIYVRADHFDSGIILTSESELLKFTASPDQNIKRQSMDILAQTKETNNASTIQIINPIDKDTIFTLRERNICKA